MSEPERPARLVLVAGTGTEVGKTWWAAATARRLRACDVAVATRKPVQSFDPHDDTTDADLLAAATGEDPQRVCPPQRSIPVAMAPPMAAEVLGRDPFTIAELVDELDWPLGCAVGLVESAGGPRSPLAHDGDTVDLAAALSPDLVVVVSDAGLGAVNATRLAADVLPGPQVVALNRFDDRDEIHRRNRDWLAREHDVVVAVGDLADRLSR